jgi:hypothetical protein
MKKEREIYLKPLTHREQVVMEQGICSASIYESGPKQVNTKGHEVGTTYNFDGTADKTTDNGGFKITWDE